MLISVLNRSADHHRYKVINGNIAYLLCADISAVLKNRNSVADFFNLGKLMRDKYNSLAFLFQCSDNLKKVLNLCVCQGRRRLVHDDYLTVGSKCLCNFNLLLFRNADILNQGFRISVQTDFCEKLFCSFVHLAVIND